MFSLPLLIADDLAELDAALGSLLEECGVRLAVFMDRGGFIVTRQGEAGDIDIPTLGALAANSFAATQAIAGIIKDRSVTSLYQEGSETSLLILCVGETGFLALVFPAAAGVGAVKFCARKTVERIARQMVTAQERAPSQGMDLAALNMGDATPLFQRRAAP